MIPQSSRRTPPRRYPAGSVAPTGPTAPDTSLPCSPPRRERAACGVPHPSRSMHEVDIFVSWHTWEQARSALEAPGGTGLDGPDVAALDRAAQAAARWHGGQLRPTGVPYMEHLLEALEVLVKGAGVTRADVL